jgi:transposase
VRICYDFLIKKMLQKDVAKVYGISRHTVSKIVGSADKDPTLFSKQAEAEEKPSKLRLFVIDAV